MKRTFERHAAFVVAILLGVFSSGRLATAHTYLADNAVTVGSWTMRGVLSDDPDGRPGPVCNQVLAVVARPAAFADNVVAILYERSESSPSIWTARAWHSSDREQLAATISADLAVVNPWEVSFELGLGPAFPPPGGQGLVPLRDFYKGLFEDDPLSLLLTDEVYRAVVLDVLTDAGYASADSALEQASAYRNELLNWLADQSVQQFRLPGEDAPIRPVRVFDPEVRPPQLPTIITPATPLNPETTVRSWEDVSPVVCSAWEAHEFRGAELQSIGFSINSSVLNATAEYNLQIRLCCVRQCATQRRLTITRVYFDANTHSLMMEHEYRYQAVVFRQRCCPPIAGSVICTPLPANCVVKPTPAAPSSNPALLPSDEPELPLLVPEPPKGPMPALSLNQSNAERTLVIHT
jgi:hypothetical protein